MAMRLLNDASVVDECSVTPEGKVRLVAFTHAPLVDLPEVREAVVAKLTTYLDYTRSIPFREAYGAEEAVEIVFRCLAEPAQPVLRAALDAGMAWCARNGVNVPVYWIWRDTPENEQAEAEVANEPRGRPTRS